MSIESVILSNHLFLCSPLLLLPSFFPSIRVFSNELALGIRWPKYYSFSFSFIISLPNYYSRLISFRIDWFDLLAVQGTLKTLFQHHSCKALILWHSAFFMVQLLHLPWLLEKPKLWLYGPLLANMSRFVIAFLPRSKHLLISWLWSPSAVILGPNKVKSIAASISPPSICYEVIGPDTMILVFLNVEF